MSRKIKLMKGNNIELLKTLPESSIDSVVTDPPYGLSFMGKKWDYDVPSVDFWKEVYRVLKPGGHVLSFGGTRTYHRMVVNMEDAGFEIRDQIMWLYGSGFPKSHNIGKAVDKVQGNKREVVGVDKQPRMNNDFGKGNHNEREIKEIDITKGNSEWEGWGTALKPANEPICMARKPIAEKTITDNVLKWRTGGINIDGCRVETTDSFGGGAKASKIFDGDAGYSGEGWEPGSDLGRFPANIILDEEAGKVLDQQSGVSKSSKRGSELNKKGYKGDLYTPSNTDYRDDNTYGDKGGASRFFYCPKVSKKERNSGCDELEEKDTKITNQSKKCSICNKWELAASGEEYICKCENPDWATPTHKNTHPTVKPVDLMSYLCRLITPPGGIVLDPFMGSGSTGMAAVKEGFRFCGMEMEAEYFTIAEKRILWSETANS